MISYARQHMFVKVRPLPELAMANNGSSRILVATTADVSYSTKCGCLRYFLLLCSRKLFIFRFSTEILDPLASVYVRAGPADLENIFPLTLLEQEYNSFSLLILSFLIIYLPVS